eukprot:CAMPEP_0114139574 /NCGR_PEP_ID=MMETSP0043_2-20121206/16928_1 /TAXON_ID=464988 /ORGANISM="Hemiselmis andersenii, Strain CCMP644" /LENGTH=129 /DNA_ID=CAMNT_0001233619 /DNA_START=480 /DNA_END=869 /DNA_ORIENTATION=+
MSAAIWRGDLSSEASPDNTLSLTVMSNWSLSTPTTLSRSALIERASATSCSKAVSKLALTPKSLSCMINTLTPTGGKLRFVALFDCLSVPSPPPLTDALLLLLLCGGPAVASPPEGALGSDPCLPANSS